MGDKSPKNNTKAKKQKASKKGRVSLPAAQPSDLRPGVVPRVSKERS